MSQQYGGLPPLTPPSPTPPTTPAGLSWIDTWIRAVTQPSEETYEAIASDTPPDSNSKAYTWVFIASVITQLITLAASFFLVRTGVNNGIFQQTQSASWLTNLLCAPIFALLFILVFAIVTGITQLVAGALGGTGNYSKLLYTTAAYWAPLSILSALIGVIPVIGCFNLIFTIYGIVLDIIAVKVVNQFSWGKAVLSSVLIWIILLVFVAVVVVIILALLGPSIGNIYSNIIRGL